jgi:hypothetical protein
MKELAANRTVLNLLQDLTMPDSGDSQHGMGSPEGSSSQKMRRRPASAMPISSADVHKQHNSWRHRVDAMV